MLDIPSPVPELKETEEQKEAESYVLEKKMIRPQTSLFTFVKHYFVFFFCILGITLSLYYGLRLYFPDISEQIIKSIEEKPVFTCIIIFAVCHIIGLFLVGEKLIVGFIHFYQHYSPDFVRRNCLFKPTCSEYAILAIEKYGLKRGLAKSIDRLRRCTGEIYQVDYP